MTVVLNSIRISSSLGTGLGLAIVKSIIRSESVDGQVDVSSTEGIGTEIRITFDAAIPDDEPATEAEKFDILNRQPTASLIGFEDDTKGTNLLRDIITMYLESWWGFQIVDANGKDKKEGDVFIVNETMTPLLNATREKNARRPIVLLASGRADADVLSAMYDFERIGGFCRLVAKPVGPSRLRQVLKACIGMISFRDGSRRGSPPVSSTQTRANTLPSQSIFDPHDPHVGPSSLARRVSHETGMQSTTPRPRIGPRANTFHPLLPTSQEPQAPSTPASPARTLSDNENEQTVSVGPGGTLLKAAIGTIERRGRINILIVEDNEILRNLL